MGDGGFFKGTSLEQDSRFSDKQKKLLKSMNFPLEFSQKVDLKKVNLSVIRPWVAQKVVELLGGEDEVVVNYVFGLLEEPDLDPRMMQINLTGFLEKNAPIFVNELWKLLLSAQEGENGIPAVFLEQKMEQIRRKQEEDERILSEIRKRREKEEEDRVKLRDIREREQREKKEREHNKPSRHRSRSKDANRRVRRSSRRRYSRSPPSEEDRRRRSHKRSKSRSRDRGRDRGREHSRERSRERSRDRSRDRSSRDRSRERSRDRRRHKNHRRSSRSRSKDRRRQDERRRRQKTPSREREDTTKRRRFSREEVITKESIDKVSHSSPEKNNRKDVNVTDSDQKKRTVESVEEVNSARSSPPRKKAADGPIFKSKWNDDEEEEETMESKKNSISALEQLEQLRAKAFESMKNRK